MSDDLNLFQPNYTGWHDSKTASREDLLSDIRYGLVCYFDDHELKDDIVKGLVDYRVYGDNTILNWWTEIDERAFQLADERKIAIPKLLRGNMTSFSDCDTKYIRLMHEVLVTEFDSTGVSK